MDQHCHKESLQFEYSIYLSIFNYATLLADLLSLQIVNKCVMFAGDYIIKYDYVGRCSGDLNTGLGNCVLMCGMIWSYLNDLNINRAEVFNNGDDMCLFVEKADFDKVVGGIERYFDDLGFKIKVEGSTEIFEEIEFCQHHPIQVDIDAWRMVKGPNKIRKHLSTAKHMFTKEFHEDYVSEIGTAGVAIYSGTPIGQEFFGQLASLPKTRDRRDQLHGSLFYMSERLESKKCNITPLARDSYCRAFGVTPAEQLEEEAMIRRVGAPRYTFSETLNK